MELPPQAFKSDSADGCFICCRLAPRASRNAVVGGWDEAVKIALTAPPVEGKANDALIKFLSGLLGVPRSMVTLDKGETSKNKIIRISGMLPEKVKEKMECVK